RGSRVPRGPRKRGLLRTARAPQDDEGGDWSRQQSKQICITVILRRPRLRPSKDGGRGAARPACVLRGSRVLRGPRKRGLLRTARAPQDDGGGDWSRESSYPQLPRY